MPNSDGALFFDYLNDILRDGSADKLVDTLWRITHAERIAPIFTCSPCKR
jgi:hypothetical protein